MLIVSDIAIRTFRVSLTCIFLFLITWYYTVPEFSWSMITAIIILFDNTTLGGVLVKSKKRFLGTFFSALYGIIIIYCCGNNALINILAFVPGLFFYAYLFMAGETVYIGVIGAVTLTIVLFNYNNMDLAILRVFNILLGTFVSLPMMLFFYPQYARDKMIGTDLKIIKELVGLYDAYLDESKSLEDVKKNYLDHEHEIIMLLNIVNTHTQETKAEPSSPPQLIMHQTHLIQYTRQIFRLSNVFVYHLTTDKIRAMPFIREFLAKILFKLKEIQCMLDIEAVPARPPSINIEAQPSSEASNEVDALETIKALMESLDQQVTLLREEVDTMITTHPSTRTKRGVSSR